MFLNNTFAITLTVVLLYLSGTAFGLWKYQCGRSSVNKIANGDPTATAEWPWVVKLNICSEVACGDCGGSLISDQWVLTAAHCIDTANDKYINATVGGDDLTTQKNITVFITKKNVYIHEKYNEDNKLHNDIALIKLNDKLNLNINIQPICLPNNIILPDNPTCVATGWGLTEKNQTSKTLLKINFPIADDYDCSELFANLGYEPSKQLCAQNPDISKSTCQGDSGGPLTCQMRNRAWVQTGIVSYGEDVDCGLKQHPTVFTRVSAYIEWINKTMAEDMTEQRIYNPTRLYSG